MVPLWYLCVCTCGRVDGNSSIFTGLLYNSLILGRGSSPKQPFLAPDLVSTSLRPFSPVRMHRELLPMLLLVPSCSVGHILHCYAYV